MTIVSRRFTACPVRTATETWDAIIKVIAAESDEVRNQLWDIVGVVASIIADEIPKKNAITVLGNGPRLRVYCLYDEDAIGDESSENFLSWKPFENDWEIHFPVEESNMDWVKKILREKNERFKVYKAGETIQNEDEKDDKQTSNFKQLTININKL